MIVVIEIGLSFDTLAATLDRSRDGSTVANQQTVAKMLHRDIERLFSSLEQYDLIANRQLPMMGEDELLQFPGYAETMAVEEAETRNRH